MKFSDKMVLAAISSRNGSIESGNGLEVVQKIAHDKGTHCCSITRGSIEAIINKLERRDKIMVTRKGGKIIRIETLQSTQSNTKNRRTNKRNRRKAAAAKRRSAQEKAREERAINRQIAAAKPKRKSKPAPQPRDERFDGIHEVMHGNVRPGRVHSRHNTARRAVFVR